MKLNKVQELLDSIPVDSKSAITELIDIKTDENMKEVIIEIRSLRSDMDTKFAAMDTKFDAKFDGLNMRIKTLYWILGVCIIPILIYVFKSFM